MNEIIFIAAFIAVMVLVLGIFAVKKTRQQREIRKKHPGYPKGYWLNQGVGIGVALGAGMGAAFGNIAIGVALGVAIGVAIGSELERKHKDEIRPITEEEKKLRKQSILFVISTFIIAVIVLLVAYLIRQ